MNAYFQSLSAGGDLAAITTFPANFHDWLALFGRMHVVVIHFPIALLLMAALGEAWGRMRGRPAGWTTASLVCGAIGAVVSMGLGWMRVYFGEYEGGSTLTLHQYMGTATAVLAIGAVFAHWKFTGTTARRWVTMLIFTTAGLVGLTGHLGGTLVHGNLLSP